MTYLLFENPKYLLLFLGIIEFFLMFSLKNIPFEKKKIIIIIIAVLIPGIHIISRLIITDNEKIEAILLKISKNSNSLQIDSITPFIDKSFNAILNKDNYNKKEFIDLLKRKVANKRINVINFKIKKIIFNKNHAISTIISLVDLTSPNGVFRLPIQWEIEWKKINNNWYMIETKQPTMVKL